MSIDSEVTSMTQNIQADYEGLENIGADLTGINKNILNIRTILDTIYNDLPKVTGEGEEVTLTPTRKGRLAITPKGNSTQESTTGKNLFNIADLTASGIISNKTSSTSGTSFTITRTAGRFADTIELPSTLQTGTTIYVSATLSNNTLTNGVFIQLGTDNQFSVQQTKEINNSITLTSGDMKYFRLFLISEETTGASAVVSNLQIEIGSSATSWEQYTGGIPAPNPSYPFPIKSVTGNNNVVVHGKNLFNGIWELGYINGNTGQNASNETLMRDKDYIEVKELTNYKFSTNSTGFTSVLVYEYKSDYSYNLTTNKGVDLSSYLTTNAGTKYIRFRPANLSTPDLSIKLQLEEGTTATTYEPYVTPQTLPLNLGTIELNKIGTYQDYIYKNNGKWYKKEQIKKVVLNGSEENWSVWFSTAGAYSCSNLIQTIDKSTQVNCISNNFSALTRSYARTNLATIDNVCATNGGEMILINKSMTTKDAFTTWLGTHNTTLYTILATSTDIEITDTNLINQLENIDKMKGYNGTTIITSTFDNSNAQMILQVSGLKGE